MKIIQIVLLFLVAVSLVSCGDGSTASGTASSNNGDGPSVILVRPSDGEVEVPLDPIISVTFDRPINCVYFDDAFSLKDPDDNEILGTITCANNIVSMTPLNQLEPATTYVITITTALIGTNEAVINDTFIWNFTTTNSFRAWSSPVKIDSHAPFIRDLYSFHVNNVPIYELSGLKPYSPQIDVNDNGIVGVAWALGSRSSFVFGREFGDAVAFTKFSANLGWGGEQTVTYDYVSYDGTKKRLSVPAVTVTSTDALVVTWSYADFENGRYIMDSNLGIISDNTTPTSLAIDFYDRPDMSEAEPGSAILAVPRISRSSTIDNKEDSGLSIFHYIEGSGWGSPAPGFIDRVGFTFKNVKVAANNSGFATVIWIAEKDMSEDPYVYEGYLCYSHYSPDVFSWWQVGCFDNASAARIEKADLGIDDQGNSVVVWSADDEIQYSVHTQDSILEWKYRPVGVLSTGNLLTQKVELAMNKRGEAVLAWWGITQNDPVQFTLQATSYQPVLEQWTDTVTLHSEVLDPLAFGTLAGPGNVVINEAGSAFIIYLDEKASVIPPDFFSGDANFYRRTDVMAVQHSPLNGWSTPQTVLADSPSWSPQIALDNAGNATAVYTIHEEFDAYVWASRYD